MNAAVTPSEQKAAPMTITHDLRDNLTGNVRDNASDNPRDNVRDNPSGHPEVSTSPDPDAASTINLVIVEDHCMVASALAATLDAERGFSVLATVTQPTELRSVLEQLTADVHVVLLDLRLGDGTDATDFIPTVRALCPGAKVVILSAWSDDRSIARVIEAGCDGYLLKDQHVNELIDGIRTVMADQPVFAPAIMKRVVGLLSPGRVGHNTLSARELDVLQRLGDGASTAEIASALYVSVNTVRNHVQSIMQKLGVHSRLEAVAHAVRSGLITVR